MHESVLSGQDSREKRFIELRALPAAIDSSDGILGVSGIFELDECEAGRVSGNPHVAETAVFTEDRLDVVSRGVIGQVANVDFAGQFPVAARHLRTRKAWIRSMPHHGSRWGIERGRLQFGDGMTLIMFKLYSFV